LIQSATDDCTPVNLLEWRFRIDLFNDGRWDTTGYSNDARGRYPIGVHKIHWIVSDQCGNEGSCSYLFEIQDCKPPTPYCLHGITTVVMPSTGCITVWASDFDAGSYDNCTDTVDLRFSFSPDSTETSRTWCCDSLISGMMLSRAVRIYVWDEFGNNDYCETYIIIQDNNNVCPDSLVGSVQIMGNITSRSDLQGLNRATVRINEATAGLEMKRSMTSADGDFAVEKLPMHLDYAISPEKDDDLLNGVTTTDLIHIQRHILGLSTFRDPFDLLAADINRSGHVSAKDLTELRKAILGLSQHFPNNKSWRFVPEGYVFPEPERPWECEEDIILYQVENDQWSKNFTAIKVGDVNRSARGGIQGGLAGRSAQKAYFLDVNDMEVQRGQRVMIPVRASEAIALQGLQLTMVLDPEAFKLETIEDGAISIAPEQLGWNWQKEGVFTMAWDKLDANTIEENEVLFTIVVHALRSSALSGHVAISSSITEALLTDQLMIERPLELRLLGRNAANNGYYLHQNRPNPFDGQTAISFELPESARVTLSIFDVTGKVLYRIDRELTAGSHTEWVDRSMLNGAGIYYYQLDAEAFTATRKMILVE